MIEQNQQILPAVTIAPNSSDSSSLWTIGGPTQGRLWAITSILISTGSSAAGPQDSLPAGQLPQRWDLFILGTPNAPSGQQSTYASDEGFRLRSHKCLNPPIIVTAGEIASISIAIRNDTATAATTTPYAAIQYYDVEAGGMSSLPGYPLPALYM